MKTILYHSNEKPQTGQVNAPPDFLAARPTTAK